MVRRRGAALVELAIALPLLSFVLLVVADFARVFHDYLTITDCSRNGALYASTSTSQSASTYQSGIASSSLADVGGLSPSPTVASATGSSAEGYAYVDVTVAYNFKTLVSYPGIPGSVQLSATTRMRVVPSSFRMQ